MTKIKSVFSFCGFSLFWVLSVLAGIGGCILVLVGFVLEAICGFAVRSSRSIGRRGRRLIDLANEIASRHTRSR